MIERIRRSEFSEDLLAQDRPVVITDALEDWRIAERWTPEYLAGAVKTRRITLSTSKDGRYRFDPSRDRKEAITFRNTEIEFGEAARRLLDPESEEHVYVLQMSIPEKLPELLDHLVVPEWIAASRPMINLWFGRRSTSPLHFDLSNNFFAQLHGAKEFTLFAPGDTPRLYPYPHDIVTAHVSHVDIERPDLAAHPEFPQARPVRFTLQPGELLFMPAFWWHQVRAQDIALSVNFWWPASLSQTLAAPNSTRALPRLHATDRLAGFRKDLLTPAQLDFVSAARLFLAHGRTWAAGLLALAALDERGRDRMPPDCMQRAAGCWLNEIADDMRPVRDALLADAALSAGQRQAIEGSALLAVQIAQSHDDAAVDRASVEALLDVVGARAGTVPS